MRLVITCLLLVAGLFPAPVSAQILSTGALARTLYCSGESRFYNALTPNPPTALVQTLAGDGKGFTFRVCDDTLGNTHYFVRKPRPNRAGICRVYDAELFVGTGQDRNIVDRDYDGTKPGWYVSLMGWKFFPPESWETLHYRSPSVEYAMIADGVCPPPDDARYFRAPGLSAGLIKAMARILDEAVSNDVALRRAFEPLLKSTPYTWETAPRMSGISLLRREVTAMQATGGKFTFIGASCSNERSEIEGCAAVVQSAPGRLKWYVYFDETASGLAIVQLSMEPMF